MHILKKYEATKPKVESSESSGERREFREVKNGDWVCRELKIYIFVFNTRIIFYSRDLWSYFLTNFFIILRSEIYNIWIVSRHFFSILFS